MSQVEQAVACFSSGFNCSQSILSTYGEALGLDRQTALKLAAGFGGGMGCLGGVCGAVTGAFMVLGLKSGPTGADKAAKNRMYELVREFSRRFTARNGSIVCKSLLNCDISTPEGLVAGKEKGLFATICPKMVRDAAEILEEMLDERR
jgi:C_GCAxxG_C_C family probable redox protein